jgi:uridine phosphorylase
VDEELRSPLLDHDPGEPPVFRPGNLLEAARRRKRFPRMKAPAGCLLDFDGELADHLLATGRAAAEPAWPCFHTRLLRWRANGAEYGMIGGTVGAPFAVLVAEELFALGCEALVSISSAGLIAPGISPPFFLLIEKALRDEGTSHHYLPAGRFSIASPSLMAVVARRMAEAEIPVHRGTSWTTDAPFRETESLIASRRKEGIVSVEMEAAALLAMGIAIGKPVICLAHVTNAMATRGEDFEKGGGAGLEESLTVCTLALSSALEHAGTKINRREGGRHE